MAQHLDVCESTGKTCFTRPEAEAKARAARRRHDPEHKGRPASAFACKACGWSHFGHLDGNDSPKKRKRR